MAEIKYILIRLPNWLGDMVMATAFVKAVQFRYPDAAIDVIAKKGIDFLLDYFPPIGERFIFSKEEYKGLTGVRKFGKKIASQKKYDLFFCLPDSLSAAVMASAIKAKKNIGFKKSMHVVFFTNAYKKKKGVHRVEEYVDLLEQFVGQQLAIPTVSLLYGDEHIKESLVVNINSEATSRRLPVLKAVSIIDAIRKAIPNEILLVGSPKEKVFVDEVFHLLFDKKSITNIAGQTSLKEMVNVFASCKAALSTDSGPAHVCNALGKKTIVLFGAGNEKNTAPFNKENCIVMRLGKLSCEPCVKNICKVYGTPECLLQLDEELIVENIIKILR
jgi:heptosyltransferase II